MTEGVAVGKERGRKRRERMYRGSSVARTL